MKLERTPGVESARKILSILLMFTPHRTELTIEDVIAEHELSQATAYRYLSLLRELSLIKPSGPGHYVLTRRIANLAAAVTDTAALEQIAAPRLESLCEETDETAFMLERSQDGARFVASHQPDRSLTLSFRPGSVMPLHRGAAAKVLLAYAPQRFQTSYLSRLVRDVEDRKLLEIELATIVENGFAESYAEVDEGIWGGAVPVFSEGIITASLSIAGPAFRIHPDARPGIVAKLTQAAHAIGSDLDHSIDVTG